MNIVEQEGAVLTGDLVKSSILSIDEKESTLATIKEIAIQFQHSTHTSVYRGDSFQVATIFPYKLLHLGILIRAYLIKSGKDARFSIALGELKRKPTKAKQGDGQAFILSGHGLDTITGTSRKIITQIGEDAFAIKREYEGINAELEIYSLILDDICSNWTKRQAQAVFFLLRSIKGKTYREFEFESQMKLAEEMKVSQQTVSKLLKAAKWNIVSEIFERYSYISDLISNGKYLHKD